MTGDKPFPDPSDWIDPPPGPGEEQQKQQDDKQRENGSGLAKQRRILAGTAFIATFIPPDWLIDGIVQRGRVYACTSLTGHGKTAVWPSMPA